MNDLQRKTFDYLTLRSTPERIRALRLLVEQDFFRYGDLADTSKNRLDKLLRHWESTRTFCAEGIQRARNALLPNPTCQVKVTLTVTVDGQVNDYSPYADGDTGNAIRDAIKLPLDIRGRRQIVGVKVNDVQKLN